MRKNGWQLPYHPLQVVAISVFLALGFAFYVFFAPFVGDKLFQYAAMGFYTPLILCVFWLYVRCAALDPIYPGILNSKKQTKIKIEGKHTQIAVLTGKPTKTYLNSNTGDKTSPSSCYGLPIRPFNCSSCHGETLEIEDGMFYCTLCKAVVSKNSKHCRVCDKCVDGFDHHCRWLNNCIGKKNYRQFFSLLVCSLFLLVFQSATGILVLSSCFLEHKRFTVEISAKLGSSFSIPSFAFVMVVCSCLGMAATLPIAQLLLFHILLIKKGISTYDYIVALREQEQEMSGGVHTPQMSPSSSLTQLSSAGSVNTFRHATWCTPPRILLEDEFDVVTSGVGAGSSPAENKPVQQIKKTNPGSVKMNPWMLARLNGKEVSKAATEARKKSKVMLPVVGIEEEKLPKMSYSGEMNNIHRKCSRASSSDSSGMGPIKAHNGMGSSAEKCEEENGDSGVPECSNSSSE